MRWLTTWPRMIGRPQVRESAVSERSSVTLKRNHSAETVALIFGVPAPLDARCSRKPRTSSDLAVSGERPRNVAKSLT